jgi:hypothetical protein
LLIHRGTIFHTFEIREISSERMANFAEIFNFPLLLTQSSGENSAEKMYEQSAPGANPSTFEFTATKQALK